MKKTTFLCVSAILLFCITLMMNVNTATSQQNNYRDLNWSDETGKGFSYEGERRIIPDNFRTVKINFNDLKNDLMNLPIESYGNLPQNQVIINLPKPDGTSGQFIINEYSMMEPGLAAQFPEIKTYTIKGVDDPYATGKVDITMHGFHAMVLSVNGNYFIDPYSSEEKNIYISYYKKDLTPKTDYDCLVTELTESVPTPVESDATGEFLRTYRLAVAATGEYTAFHGGTAALGQAAIVTAMNRVNGVYEKDFSVRMTLVANNINIVYTNSGTDPYTNNNGGTMLGQNQTNLDAVIGNANYDVGHVFSTGGGGIAGLGVVCVTGQKARGVTGLPSPTGDPFYIDYVAHEMGHQYRGNHTFNGVLGSCAGGNRNAATAWEPGSGSTIMGYAGICGADDLQLFSNDHFHSGSITEITNYTQTGNGNSCPVQTATGNTPPSVTVPAGGFSIPISTPFQLTGSATDVNNPGSLTYNWEQYDVGPAGSPNSPTGNAPIFRSFSSVTTPTRIFPKLLDIINNTQTLGEILPSYTRSLSFRMTVRDNNAGAGGIGIGTVAFNVTAAAGPFIVSSPNTNVNWNSSVPQTITWNVANTTASPVSCANVNILLSTDGGNTYPHTLITGTPNDGSQSVTLPGVNTTTARIKVEANGNIFFDISNTNFQISNTNLPSISHTPITDQVKTAWPVTVDAVVTSAFSLDSSWVRWYKNITANTKHLKLVNTSGNNYSALFNSLNSDVVVGDVIYYKIFAQNNSAGHERDSTALYSFNIVGNNLCENFTSVTFPPSGWSLEYTGTLYWTRNAVSSFGVGSGSTKFDFWNAGVGVTQSEITKSFGNTLSGDSLNFDHAYAPYTDGSTDSLEILTSSNGGTTFTSLVKLWGNNVNGNLNTRTPLGTAFTPTSVQWATKKYSLPAGTNKLKFRARSGFGNNLYLDKICVVNAAVAIASDITLVPEGFYNISPGNLNIRDTVTVYLRNSTTPFAKIDSAKSVLDSVTLKCAPLFTNAPNGTYYLHIKHRNALETWSKSGGESYSKGSTLVYDFTSAQSQTYGNNSILKGTKYSVYSGDVDQDGTIDISDGSLIDNDAFNFASGYLPTDVNGDGLIDLSDGVYTDNNGANFVSKITP
ncbi:MAG: hypothetical protein IPM96_10210 [Ignavibacteria bacterium]|nr:hypothetical protein [Ignavibacteria bacterium]